MHFREDAMSDFYQSGPVTTLHRLGERKPEVLEQQLERFAQDQPVALILPALSIEFEKPAMAEILAQLCQVRYISQFVVTLAQTSRTQFREIHERLSILPGQVSLIWNDGPRVQSL